MISKAGLLSNNKDIKPRRHMIFWWPVTCDSVSMQWEQLPPMGSESQPSFVKQLRNDAKARQFQRPSLLTIIQKTSSQPSSPHWLTQIYHLFLKFDNHINNVFHKFNEKDMASFQIHIIIPVDGLMYSHINRTTYTELNLR